MNREDRTEWWAGISDKKSFTFPNLHSEGMRLYYRLLEAIKDKDEPEARRLLEEMQPHTLKNYSDKTDLEKWAHMAVQMPGDWGPISGNKLRLKNILTRKARGRVLEAMCGFTTYFGDKRTVSEVIALDYCGECLERYEAPERKRILFNLERVCKGERLDFFEDSFFDTVGVFFSVPYLSKAVPVYAEFNRLLSNNGRVLVVSGTSHGYGEMVKEWFKPDKTARYMQEAGFRTSVRHLRSFKTRGELGEYYLVEGVKQ